jgi:putative isomerase
MKKFLICLVCCLIIRNANSQFQYPREAVETAHVFNIENIDSLVSRLRSVNKDIYKEGIKLYPEGNAFLLTGYSYGEFYDWDLYFENLYMSYFGVSEYCFTNLKAFLRRQLLNGFVSRSLIMSRPHQHFKPFLAQISWLGSMQRNEFSWLNEEVITSRRSLGIGTSYYFRLKEYLRYWFWFQDFDKNGLPVWNSADHSGMDNQISRAGRGNEFRFEGVDLACYLCRELESMALLAEKLGLPDDVKLYRDHALKLKKLINKTFWDEKDGFYYDRDEQTGALVKVKSVAGFMPMFIGAASKKQAERLVKEHLLNENEFWTEFPVPAYSKTEPDYDQHAPTAGECNWRGTAWIPTNYMVFHGLMDYGYVDIAKTLASKSFTMVYKANNVTREYYNAETGAGFGLNPFWGWSTLAYFMPFEFVLEYNPSALDNKPIRAIGKELLGICFGANENVSEYVSAKLQGEIKTDGDWEKPPDQDKNW